MKILVAGSTGAIGKPLVEYLVQYGQEVYGITHSEERAQFLASVGAKSIFLDVLDRDAVATAIENIHPDVVIDMLTSLPKEYTPEAMRKASELNTKLRREGSSNLQSAAEKCGTRRYIVQSSAFWYAPGTGLADETTPFAYEATPAISAGTLLYAETEKRVLQSNKIEGVALRFGFFYGPGTWFNPDGSMGEQIREGRIPIIGSGEGVWNFVHIEDAARAAAAAVYISPGAYNIVNNRPTKQKEWLPGFARYVGGPHPSHISEEVGVEKFGPDFTYYATKLRGASNAKIKHEFNFDPRTFEWVL